MHCAIANEALPLAANPELETQVNKIAVELRCLVCQNETIAGSNAELAVDLRQQIRDQLQNGKSKEDIMTYMVDRYGDFVLYKPPVKISTMILWFGPFILLFAGSWTLFRHIRRENRPVKTVQDSVDELSQARALLSSVRKDSK
jgi:cytochrome c-type biogenesis protein CcmH